MSFFCVSYEREKRTSSNHIQNIRIVTCLALDLVNIVRCGIVLANRCQLRLSAIFDTLCERRVLTEFMHLLEVLDDDWYITGIICNNVGEEDDLGEREREGEILSLK